MLLLDSFTKPVSQAEDTFKRVWKMLAKSQTGDTVMFEGQKYVVEGMVPLAESSFSKNDPSKGDTIFTLCRYESPDGVKLQVTCHHVQAFENEFDAA